MFSDNLNSMDDAGSSSIAKCVCRRAGQEYITRKKQDNSELRNLEKEIIAQRDQIIQESRAIDSDRRKLKEAGRISDKTESERVKQEINQDIEKRKAAIADLKKDINKKRDRQHDIKYGSEPHTPRRVK